MALPLDLDSLKERISLGEEFKFLFFYGYGPNRQAIESSCLSQWYQSEFVVEDVVYRSAEHWMMAEKARLFYDDFHLDKILKSQSPAEAKSWGRKVRGFQTELWQEECRAAVIRGNLAKFRQNPRLLDYLISTDGTILAEAARRDPIWGIGLNASDADALLPSRWKGLNLLGFALMEVRAILCK